MQIPWLTLLISTPLIFGLALFFIPSERRLLIRILGILGAGFALVLSGIVAGLYQADRGGFQLQEKLSWIPNLGSHYSLGIDGISLSLILLTTLLTLVALVYAWRHEERGKEFFFLFLLMETGLLGLFSSLDLILFYLFWEVALVPLYFVIGIWGHEKRRHAAMKFFLYTRIGALAMLLSFLALHLQSDPHTFDIPTLIARHPFAGGGIGGWLVFLGLFLGFGVKLPVAPLHNWLADAHVEAPTPGSVMLAGVLLKQGGYGFIRIGLEIMPEEFARWAVALAILALISIIYAAAVALAQSDFKRLVAFTSINHMGFVLLGVSAAAVSGITPAQKTVALNGAVLQMLSHGLLTGGMFIVAGILQDRAGTREIEAFGGLWKKMPTLTGLALALAFGSFGLPGFSGFIAEFQILSGALSVFPLMTVLSLIGIILSTALYLWAVQRIFLRPREEAKRGLQIEKDLSRREAATLAALVAFSLLIGIYPWSVLSLMSPTVAQSAAVQISGSQGEALPAQADQGR